MTNGTLWRAVVETSRLAVDSGDLHTIDTRPVRMEDAGLRFVVRVARSLARKRIQGTRHPPGFDPFLPPEPALTVAPVGDAHVAVLNKFNVVAHHLLVVTRAFEHQERLLTACDFAALWRCLADFPSLGFYNGGRVSGASQAHKHLQLVPVPLYPGDDALPFDALFRGGAPGHAIQSLSALPFRHAFARLRGGDGRAAATGAHAVYRELLAAAGIGVRKADDGERHGMPYNLLATREWLFVVPRTAESARGVPVNGLGFAGSLFVPDAGLVDAVRAAGPLRILAEVAAPA